MALGINPKFYFVFKSSNIMREIIFGLIFVLLNKIIHKLLKLEAWHKIVLNQEINLYEIFFKLLSDFCEESCIVKYVIFSVLINYEICFIQKFSKIFV